MKVGFIGLGIMGESMCERIITVGGYDTTVFDRNGLQVDKLVALGAKKANSIAEVAKNSTHIVIMVPNNEAVISVVNEIIPAMNAGTRVIDMSTISPTVSCELAKKVAQAGGVMMDAPVVKSKPAAISGDLGIYVGGSSDVFEEIKPLLSCMGKNIIFLGTNGSGLTMKLCHNTLVAQIQNGVNEMMLLANKSGISADQFYEAVSYGGGQNFYLDGKWKVIKEENFKPAFPFEHMAKDLTLTSTLAETLDMSLPGLQNVVEVYKKGLELNLNREDFSASFKVVRECL